MSARAFLARGSFSGSGCVILDVNLPDLDGFRLQEEMKNAGLQLPVIFITGYGDVPMAVKAMRGGATNFLTKPFLDSALLAALSEAIEMQKKTCRDTEESESHRALIETLTTREKEILSYVIAGKLNKQIAAELGIAETTVKVHRGRIMSKLGAQSLAELIRLSEKAGISPASTT
jgi:FixJ family two-component response regulator